MKLIFLRFIKKSFYMQHLHSFCFLTKTNLTNYTNVVKTFNFYTHILYVHNVRKIRNGSHFVQSSIIIISTNEEAHEFFQEFINFLGKKDWGVLGGIFAGGLIIVGVLLWKFGGPGQPESPNQPEDKKTSSSGAATAALVPPPPSFLRGIWLNFKTAFNIERNEEHIYKQRSLFENILSEHEIFLEYKMVCYFDFYLKQQDLIKNLIYLQDKRNVYMQKKIKMMKEMEDILSNKSSEELLILLSQKVLSIDGRLDEVHRKENLLLNRFIEENKKFKSEAQKFNIFFENISNLEKVNKMKREKLSIENLTRYLYKNNVPKLKQLNTAYLNYKTTMKTFDQRVYCLNSIIELHEEVFYNIPNIPKDPQFLNNKTYFYEDLYKERSKVENELKTLALKTKKSESNYIGMTKRAKTYAISVAPEENLVRVTLDFNEHPEKIETYNKILHSYLRNYDQDYFAKVEKFLLKKESLPINLKNKVNDTYNGVLQEFACDCEMFSVSTGIHYYKRNTEILFPAVFTLSKNYNSLQRNIIIILTGEGAQEFINFLSEKDWGILGGIFAGGLIIVGALLWKFGGPGQPNENPNQPEPNLDLKNKGKVAAVPPSRNLLSRMFHPFFTFLDIIGVIGKEKCIEVNFRDNEKILFKIKESSNDTNMSMAYLDIQLLVSFYNDLRKIDLEIIETNEEIINIKNRISDLDSDFMKLKIKKFFFPDSYEGLYDVFFNTIDDLIKEHNILIEKQRNYYYQINKLNGQIDSHVNLLREMFDNKMLDNVYMKHFYNKSIGPSNTVVKKNNVEILHIFLCEISYLLNKSEKTTYKYTDLTSHLISYDFNKEFAEFNTLKQLFNEALHKINGIVPRFQLVENKMVFSPEIVAEKTSMQTSSTVLNKQYYKGPYVGEEFGDINLERLHHEKILDAYLLKNYLVFYNSYLCRLRSNIKVLPPVFSAKVNEIYLRNIDEFIYDHKNYSLTVGAYYFRHNIAALVYVLDEIGPSMCLSTGKYKYKSFYHV